MNDQDPPRYSRKLFTFSTSDFLWISTFFSSAGQYLRPNTALDRAPVWTEVGMNPSFYKVMVQKKWKGSKAIRKGPCTKAHAAIGAGQEVSVTFRPRNFSLPARCGNCQRHGKVMGVGRGVSQGTLLFRKIKDRESAIAQPLLSFCDLPVPNPCVAADFAVLTLNSFGL